MGVYTDFVTNISGLSVTGVSKTFTTQPSRLSTSQLPAMWPRIPSGSAGNVVLCGSVGLTEVVCELLVAIEPVDQSNNDHNFSACLTIMDNLQTALAAQMNTYGIDRWSMRLRQQLIGETAYWTVTATVEGKL
jgi:hypothetical protein